ncbi:carbohydrate kinase family protein [Telmatospirillum sp.]|uniref:carbohydrate kinase family protein n=1 Tax=Telmatospirillum sp. TaxID=2079197 RepID=UPI00283C56C0|nr:carbohydrate kinase family protein [Telmatospirillum sp.]MDR3435049.1 carbohydrate kinase family protein [Telmatospirillum sp.]
MHHISAYPPESLLAVICDSSHSPGGGAFNVLCDLACVDPTLPLAVAGLVGDDEDGRIIRGEFERRGIDGSRIATVADRPTSFTHVMISEANATRTFFHSHGANSRLGLDLIHRLDGSARMAHLAYLLLLEGLDVPDSDYGSGGAHALAILQEKGFRTSLDLVSEAAPERYLRFVVPALPYTDYLIVNDVEAAHLTATGSATLGDTPDWDLAFVQADSLLAMGVKRLVAIHFPAGAVAMTRSGERCRQTSYRVSNVVSALGAGDAFCAGMLFGIHEGYALDMCLKLGVGLAHFNLFATSATAGAVPLARLRALIAEKEQASVDRTSRAES